MEARFGLGAELKGIQREWVLLHGYLELTIPVCTLNAESHFNSWGLQLMISIHGLFLQITFTDSTEFLAELWSVDCFCTSVNIVKTKMEKLIQRIEDSVKRHTGLPQGQCSKLYLLCCSLSPCPWLLFFLCQRQKFSYLCVEIDEVCVCVQLWNPIFGSVVSDLFHCESDFIWQIHLETLTLRNRNIFFLSVETVENHQKPEH